MMNLPSEVDLVSGAWISEMGRLLDRAEKLGASIHPDFSSEKRAAFASMQRQVGEAGMAEFDLLAWRSFAPDEKIAFLAGLDIDPAVKEAGIPGSFLKALGRRGVGDAAARTAWSQYQTMGPRGYARMRRLQHPLTGGMQKGKLVPGGATQGSPMMKDLKSGFLFGGAFGLGGRLLGKEPEPQVQVGY